jgi:hypothetical protein
LKVVTSKEYQEDLMSNYLRRLTAVTSAFLIITVAGCATVIPGKFTAGGTVPNPASDNGKATFTGHADSCNAPPTKLDVNYDGHDGVTLKSTDVAAAGQCVESTGPNSAACGDCQAAPTVGKFAGGTGPLYAADFTYESKNPDMPGTGHAVICVQDNGNGSNASTPDEGAIIVFTGPFAPNPTTPYFVGGPLSGNVTAHPCS